MTIPSPRFVCFHAPVRAVRPRKVGERVVRRRYVSSARIEMTPGRFFRDSTSSAVKEAEKPLMACLYEWIREWSGTKEFVSSWLSQRRLRRSFSSRGLCKRFSHGHMRGVDIIIPISLPKWKPKNKKRKWIDRPVLQSFTPEQSGLRPAQYPADPPVTPAPRPIRRCSRTIPDATISANASIAPLACGTADKVVAFESSNFFSLIHLQPIPLKTLVLSLSLCRALSSSSIGLGREVLAKV
ncbi:translation initiation factor SUI1 family protein [Striga asiatica]|uniref:Translation initiation factor SUI1 family protein n=1 Tax=Striga asiatica TaxID=4170 RepID=A0A5A7QIV0_STRAF|nr:translation initiation factor SUI1 family protein [Striga asiatica]